MVLGYNERRPTRENYEDFIEKLSNGLRPLAEEGLSLMFYGSYVRRDSNLGRSDIDALLIFPSDVVIDKKHLHKASIVLADAQRGNNIPFQVTVTDLRTMQEGTFNSYGPEFLPYFESEREVIIGEDYSKTFRYSMPKHSDLVPLRFNLRKSRTGLFFSEFYKEKDYERFLESFNKTLDAVSRASKQILHMVDGNLRKNRFSALDELLDKFPNLDIEPLRSIKTLYNNLDELDLLYRKPEELMVVWNDSVTFFEELVKSYIDKKVGILKFSNLLKRNWRF
jgi:predicted nucleotidyltransferase